jgi:hypothetical protein
MRKKQWMENNDVCVCIENLKYHENAQCNSNYDNV